MLDKQKPRGDQDLFGRFVTLNWLFNKKRLVEANKSGERGGFGPHGFTNRPHHHGHNGSTENGAPLDSTRGQGRILALLKLRDDIPAKDLSFLLGITVSSLNETLVKLERGGYIVREPSETDRRVILVRITDKGRAVNVEAPSRDDLFTTLTEEERSALAAILDKLIDNIEGQFADENPYIKQFEAEMRKKMGDEGFEHWAVRNIGFRHMMHHAEKGDLPFWKRPGKSDKNKGGNNGGGDN